MKLKSLLFSSLLMTAYFSNAQCPQITCPSDITVSTDPGSCDAVVTYTAPQGTDPCASGTQTFSYTGSVQTFTVPNGVTEISIDAYGAQGNSNALGVVGGLGGNASGDLSVTGGQVINIYVGGGGTTSTSGGFNGGGDAGSTPCADALGGGGGGASDIRVGGTTLNDRVLVAAGGAGAGGNRVQGCGRGTGGGGGGGYYGGGGGAGWPDNGTMAGGGTQSAGGAGGTSTWSLSVTNDGTAGSLGIGGNGGDEESSSQTGSFTAANGADAGGLTGSAGTYAGTFTGASGGGGSSYIGGVNNGSINAGTQTGNGEIVLSWSGGGSTLTTSQTAGQASGSTFALGTNVQTFEVSDGNGNTDQCSFNIIVVDANDPVADNANLADVEASCEVNSLTAPTATDLCDGSISGVSDAVFPIDNDTVVVWTYTDAEGNAVTQNQNVVITGVDVGISLSGATITADNGNADSYQWINCADSSTVTDATGQSFTPSANGDYAVIVTEGNCSDTSACETVSTVGIEDFGTNQSISIYPNPNTGQFSVNFESEVTQAEIKVYDLQGRIVESYMTKNTSTQMINLEEQSGTFMITVTTEHGTQNFRVVVQ